MIFRYCRGKQQYARLTTSIEERTAHEILEVPIAAFERSLSDIDICFCLEHVQCQLACLTDTDQIRVQTVDQAITEMDEERLEPQSANERVVLQEMRHPSRTSKRMSQPMSRHASAKPSCWNRMSSVDE